ncbi:hypothetical protein JTB14_031305 [Gonioctena quinquepunctata]|nr:hypothetical protein JTB14_031305 [Gonioctena quinquepunctata]
MEHFEIIFHADYGISKKNNDISHDILKGEIIEEDPVEIDASSKYDGVIDENYPEQIQDSWDNYKLEREPLSKNPNEGNSEGTEDFSTIDVGLRMELLETEDDIFEEYIVKIEPILSSEGEIIEEDPPEIDPSSKYDENHLGETQDSLDNSTNVVGLQMELLETEDDIDDIFEEDLVEIEPIPSSEEFDPFNDDGEFNGDSDYVPDDSPTDSSRNESESERRNVEDDRDPEQNHEENEGLAESIESIWEEVQSVINNFHFDATQSVIKIDGIENMSPIEVFRQIWNNDVMYLLLTSTNSYGSKLLGADRPKTRNSRSREFKPVTENSLDNSTNGVGLQMELLETEDDIDDIFEEDLVEIEPIPSSEGDVFAQSKYTLIISGYQ